MRVLIILLSLTAPTIFTGCAGGPKRESTGEFIDSAAITTKVKAALASDERVSALDVKVVTYKGSVQLSGWVDSYEEREAAEEVTSNVSGVENVENLIRVKKD